MVREKKASEEAMMECVGVDWFEGQQRIDDIGGMVELPDAHDDGLGDVPRYFILNLQLPGGKVVSMKRDGPGYVIAFYFRLTDRTRNFMKDIDNAPNSVKLLKKYLQYVPPFRCNVIQ